MSDVNNPDRPAWPFYVTSIGTVVLATLFMWFFAKWTAWEGYQRGMPGTLTLKVDAGRCAEMFGPAAIPHAKDCRIKAVYGIHPFTDQFHVRRPCGETVIDDWRSSLVMIEGPTQVELETFLASHVH